MATSRLRLAPVGWGGVAQFIQQLDSGLYGGETAGQGVADGFGLGNGPLSGRFCFTRESGRQSALMSRGKHSDSGIPWVRCLRKPRTHKSLAIHRYDVQIGVARGYLYP